MLVTAQEKNNRAIFKRTIVVNGVVVAIAIASIINGVLYFAISVDGGGNIKKIFDVGGGLSDAIIYSVGVGSSLVYTMFTYKTLEALSLRINSVSKFVFSLFAPFSAIAFLTAGKDGAELLNLNSEIALSIGISLFLLRIVNCVDASVKFPARFFETKKALVDSLRERDFFEIARLAIIWLSSIGYVACTTDAIYSATQIVSSWFGIPHQVSVPLSYISSVIGAIGTLPLNVYWSHRGLRQLTFGGRANENGVNPDPTDRYTYLGLILVTPVMLGILGAATSSTGAVFGRLGIFSQVTRVVTSTIYAVCAGTPGMATLLRGIFNRINCCNNKNNMGDSEHEETALLENSEVNGDQKILSKPNYKSWCGLFRKSTGKKLDIEHPGEEIDEEAKQRSFCTIQ